MNVITDNDYFSEMVVDGQQEATLLLFFFWRRHMESRLDIDSVWRAIYDKINL